MQEKVLKFVVCPARRVAIPLSDWRLLEANESATRAFEQRLFVTKRYPVGAANFC